MFHPHSYKLGWNWYLVLVFIAVVGILYESQSSVLRYRSCNISLKGSLGATVKWLPCDLEVTGSSRRNSLLRCRVRLRTIDPKWSDPSLDPAQQELRAPGCPFMQHFLDSCVKGSGILIFIDMDEQESTPKHVQRAFRAFSYAFGRATKNQGADPRMDFVARNSLLCDDGEYRTIPLWL